MQQAVNSPRALISRACSLMKGERAPYISLVIISLVIRLWGVGARGLHHDESIHVTCPFGFFDKPLHWCLQGWTHGPLQFEGTSFFYIFGTNDVTARLLPVVFGTAIVALPYLLRRQLGHWGSLVVSALLAFSPLLMFYSRYARNDIYIAFFMLLLVVCVWRYVEERKPKFLYIGAAALSLSYCTKEVSYIGVAIIGIFLAVLTFRELAKSVVKGFNFKGLSAHAEYLILIGTLSLPLFAPFVNIIKELESDLFKTVDNALWFNTPALVIIILMFVVGAAIGLRWNWRRWLVSALIFWGIYILMYTIFFTKTQYLNNGLWETVAYWVRQHEVERGSQPEFYYIMVVPVYEFLPVLFASIGTVYYTIKESLFPKFLIFGAVLATILYAFLDLKGAGATVLVAWAAISVVLYVHFGRASPFVKFLLYWVALTLILFSFFGEKMPWLSVHVALPAIVFGGMFIGRLLNQFNWRRWKESKPSRGTYWIVALLGVLAIVVGIVAAVTAPSIGGYIAAAFIVGIILTAIGLASIWKKDRAKPWMAQSGIAFVLVILFIATAFVAVKESQQTSDEPPQMLIYSGISEDMKHTMEHIYEFAEESGLGYDLPVIFEGGGLFDLGPRFYLRDYKNIIHSFPKAGPPENAVVFFGEKKYKELVGNESWMADYEEVRQIKTHLWFPEAVYKGQVKDYGLRNSLGWWFRYFFMRDTSLDPETPKPYWTNKGYVYFPKSSP